MNELDWPKNRVDASDRARVYVNKDPFPHIPRALLSKEHIVAYAAKAGMIYPAVGISKQGEKWMDDEGLKTASYETRPGFKTLRYNEQDELVTHDIKGDKHGVIVLPPNSITFVSTEDEFFLPNYIALRFNLRIKHVHRGLLLGTGPLVDPGYDKRILIPLHNLTDSPYHISTEEGLIWVEFTKTSALHKGEVSDQPPHPEGVDLDLPHSLPKTTKKNIEEHLFKANAGSPIRSSIPKAVMDAQRSAKLAEKRSRTLQTIGIVALISLAIGLVSVFVSVLTLVTATQAQLRSVENRLGELER